MDILSKILDLNFKLKIKALIKLFNITILEVNNSTIISFSYKG